MRLHMPHFLLQITNLFIWFDYRFELQESANQ